MSSFAPGSVARRLFATVRQAISELEARAAAESGAGGTRRQNTAGKAVAYEALRDRLVAVRRTVRALASTTPGLDEKFRIPLNASAQVLLNTARAFAAEALPLKDLFISYEMPQHFIEDLNASITNLEQAIQDQNASKGAHRSAVASIDESIALGMEAVRQLDPIIRNKFDDQPTVLADWKGARRIHRGPSTQAGGGNGNNDPQPPAQ